MADSPHVAASLRALLTGVIDYAGMFPPAKLPLEEAIRNYLRYRQEPESWMLARFICPAARLQELNPYLGKLSGPPVAIVALGQGGANLQEFKENLRTDKEAIATFRHQCANKAVVDVFEVRLPPDLPKTVTAAELLQIEQLFPDPDGMRFFEAGSRQQLIEEILAQDSEKDETEDWKSLHLANLDRQEKTVLRMRFGLADEGPKTIKEIGEHLGLTPERVRQIEKEALVKLNVALPTKLPAQFFTLHLLFPGGGLKVRCGGPDPAAYPTPKELAFVIERCSQFSLPLKFTAGLHHPIRHFNHEARTHMHGFVNVLMAGLMHRAHRCPAEPILADEDANHFLFTDDRIRWKDAELAVETNRLIRQFRHKFVSFGSCSFDEPRDDLRKIGWLPS
jgi:RNA polymerase sigma factor (sigma-70 family)